MLNPLFDSVSCLILMIDTQFGHRPITKINLRNKSELFIMLQPVLILPLLFVLMSFSLTFRKDKSY